MVNIVKFPDLSNSTKVQKASPLSVRVTPLLARIATPRRRGKPLKDLHYRIDLELFLSSKSHGNTIRLSYSQHVFYSILKTLISPFRDILC